MNTNVGLLVYCVLVLAAYYGAINAAAHGHQGCGHSLVADEARRWSQLHRQHNQRIQQRGAAAAGTNSSQTADGQLQGAGQGDRPAPRLLAETASTVPIRIWVEYQGIEQLSADGKQQLYDTVNIALGVLQKFYKVRRPAPGRLTVRPFCRMWDSANYCNQHQPDFLGSGADNTCGSALINSSHIATYTQCSLGGFNCNTFPGGAGEFTDYYLYITARQDEHCSSGAVAWALPCLYDDATNRPLLGSANICPEALMNSEPESGVAVLVHELTHALGFTDDMFDKFVDAEGQPIPENQVVQEYVDAYGRTTSMIITPTVKQEVQAQFGCDRVPGAALENEGGQGSAMAHWEYRWFQGELMVATNLFAVYGKPATMSRITLAFMQDTGWYDVNWEHAGFLNWGWKAGCDFVAKTCSDFMDAHPSQEFFCTRQEYADTVNTVCTFDGLARAKCEEAQFADGCTMKVALGTVPNCLSKQYSSAAGDKFGWQNGLTSRCMPVTWLFNTFSYQFPDSTYKDGWQDSMCYKSSCTAAGKLQLEILGNKVDCPTGQLVDLAKALPAQFTKGVIGPCPDNKAMCDSLSCGESCTVGGTCVEGKCYCNLQYTGPACAKKLTPDGNYTNYVPVVDDFTPAAAGNVFDNGYLMMSARLQNDEQALRLSLDKYKSAVAQLAGVTASRVAVLSFLTDAPATSLIGRHRHHLRRLAASVDDDSTGLMLLSGDDATASDSDSSVLVDGLAAGSEGEEQDSSSYLALLSSSSRQLLQVSSGQLEVYSRISTQNAADAAAITARINNATRQSEFEESLKSAGLRLVPGSINIRTTDASGGPNGGNGWGLPGINMSDPNTRRIIIIVAASVGAGLLVMLIGWAVSCCMRRKHRQRSSSQQQFLTGPPGAAYYSPGSTPNSSRGSSTAARPSGGVRPLFGAAPAAAAAGSRPAGRLENPFAGSNIQFGAAAAGGGGRRAATYSAPPAAATFGPSAAAVPAGGYTVQGQTFRTLQEAEEYQLALALQRSLQQSGPTPGRYLPHSSATNSPVWGQQQQQPSGYPAVGYGYSR